MTMDAKVRELVKFLAARRGLTLKDLAAKLTEKTSKNYTIETLSQRLRRGTFTYNEVLVICEILHYKIDVVDEL